MSELRLPTRMYVYFQGKEVVVYYSGDNPRQDGNVAYYSSDKSIRVIVNPKHKGMEPQT